MLAKLLPPWMPCQTPMRRFFSVLRGAKWKPGRSAATATGATPVGAEGAESAEGADDDLPRGCGWFDSSHDLQHGCRVQEHLSADSLARELPLSAWLDVQLGSWRTAASAGEPPALTRAA